MELEKLKKFIKFMEDNNLNELEIEEEGKRIKLKKDSGAHNVAIPVPEAASAAKEAKKDSTLDIASPMVGTFYRAPSPGAKPYVEVGDTIKPGDVVCIVEAMKLMNEIKAESSGKIVQISVENGEPVEFGQALFEIDPL